MRGPGEDRVQFFKDRMAARYAHEFTGHRFEKYRDNPHGFAYHVLGSRWWHDQEEIARLLVQHRRVAVKSANGVGKTYLAADLALWFLYCHQPAVVLTTAPTWRQVRFVLWQEIRRRFRTARARLPGDLLTTRLSAGEGWFAIGLATDEPAKFQGFHARNLLVIFDEASGIPDSIWDAAEGVAVGTNNKILAIGNPLQCSGRFYRAFAKPGPWKRWTISALSHPNITGKGPRIDGAVSHESIEANIAQWCQPADPAPLLPSPACGRGAGGEGPDSTGPPGPCSPFPVSEANELGKGAGGGVSAPDHFSYNGKTYTPNNLFRARVLGQFPTGDDEALIPLRWIEAAAARTLTTKGFRRMAADIARFGADSTVIGIRNGPSVTYFKVLQGKDLMEISGHINRLAYEFQPEMIAVDSIGLGAGVVDRLIEMGTEGIEGINVSLPAFDSDRFANRRAELFYGLRERFRVGDIDIPADERLIEELAALKYRITSRGQIQMESKDDMKRRGETSPDAADMLALLFDGPGEAIIDTWTQPGAASRFRAEMQGW